MESMVDTFTALNLMPAGLPFSMSVTCTHMIQLPIACRRISAALHLCHKHRHRNAAKCLHCSCLQGF